MNKLYAVLLATLMCAGCAGMPDAPDGFEIKTIETEHFSIPVYEKNVQKGAPLRIYIEGDGNPAPKRAVGLILAQKDPSENVVYITRPCQYNKNTVCNNPDLWGQERYHIEIINEMKELVTYLARKHQATRLELVGYGGGAPIALLLANRMSVSRVITIAGILDTDAYCHQNGLPLMPNAVNPARERKQLAAVPQIHYVGADDTVTTKRLAERFVARLPNPVAATVKVVPETGHTDWDDVEFDYY